MARKPFGAFKKGALALAGLTVAAGMLAMSSPDDQAPEQGAIPVIASAPAPAPVEIEDVSVEAEASPATTDASAHPDPTAVDYQTQPAPVDLEYVAGQVVSKQLMDQGGAAVQKAIHGVLGQIAASGFMEKNLETLQSDPETVAKALRDELRSRTDEVVYVVDPTQGNPHALIAEAINITDLCTSTLDADHANRARLPKLTAEYCSSEQLQELEAKSPGFEDLLQARQEKADSIQTHSVARKPSTSL